MKVFQKTIYGRFIDAYMLLELLRIVQSSTVFLHHQWFIITKLRDAMFCGMHLATAE